MKTKSTLIILILISMMLSATTVAAEYELELSELNIVTTQGTNSNTQGTLTNLGPDTIDVSFASNILTLQGPNSETLTVSITYFESHFQGLQEDDSASITASTSGIAADQAPGTYNGIIELSINDSGVITTQEWPITVQVNEENTAPYFTSVPITNAIVGESYNYQATAQDDQDDTLTFSKHAGPTGLSVSSSGLVSWTPTVAGDYDVIINVTDGEFITQQEFTINVIQAGGTIQFSSINMGSSNQERTQTITQTFTVSNNGASPVTNIQISTIDLDNKYQAVFTPSSTTIPSQGSIEVTIELYVPEDENSGNNKIGNVRITGDNAVTTTQDLFLETRNHLSIKRATMIVNNDASRTIRDGRTISNDDIEFKPGDELTFEITIENTYDRDSNDYDLDIEDIIIYLEADRGDIYWDEEYDIRDLRAEADDIITINVDIPRDAEEDRYDVTILVEGYDENGARHSEQMRFTLDLELERDDVRFNTITVTPSNPQCGDNVRVSFNLENVGRDDQRDVVIRLENNELDISQVLRAIRINSGSRLTQQMNFFLPEDLRAGTYHFTAEVFTSQNTRDLTDIESLVLSISCPTDTNGNDDDDEDKDPIDITPTPTPTTPPTGQVIASSTGRPISGFEESTVFWMMIIVVILLVLLIVLLVVKK